MDFNTAFERLIDSEGGYTDDPNDGGNWTGGRQGAGVLKGTKFGIAANTYPLLDIKGLTVEQAKAIYRRDFWDVLGNARPSITFQVFDFAVNSGIGTAIRKLQDAIGVADDGQWGPLSAAALEQMDENDVLLRLIGLRLEFMSKLKAFDVYGRGWSRRIAKNLLYAAQDN